MIVPPRLDVGACTHTGRVRSTNEDDFLLFTPPADAEDVGFVAVLADGMGGLVGGADASRLAVRALASELAAAAVGDLDEDGEDGGDHHHDRYGGSADGRGESDRETDGEERRLEAMRRGYERAAAAIADRARRSPRLHDMGTTLTAVCFDAAFERCVLGHIGDTRCLLVRDGQVVQWTTDHTVEAASHLLTRCLGAGSQDASADLTSFELRRGDVLVLVTDGVSNAIPSQEIASVVRSRPAARAAAELVQAAFDRSGADNATVLVVGIESGAAAAHAGESTPRDVSIPAAEPDLRLPDPRPDHRLVAPRWPWLVWVAAVLVALVAWAYGAERIALAPEWPFVRIPG